MTDQVDRRVLDAGVVVLAWAAAWLAVRLLGDGNVAVASAYAVPVALAAHRFDRQVGMAVAIASAAFAGPLSPALDTAVTDAEAATFAVCFAAVAAVVNLVRRPLAPDTLGAPSQTGNFDGIARELRTPVQAILGAVTLLDHVLPRDGEERVAIGTLGRAAERLHDLETLLTAVGEELTTERRADDHVLVDLRQVAGDVAAELRRHGGLERMRFDAAHDADVLMGHQQRIHLLLRCLAGDALEVTPSDQPVDVSIRRDVDNLVVRICANSEGAHAVGGRIRLIAARELATRLGGELDALDAGGALQVTVRLPQRRDTDPTAEDARRAPRPFAPPTDVWTSGRMGTGTGMGTNGGVWARVSSS
ncbi:MAG TPA: hypothetical protein VGA69_04335 [Nitriliruptorales bacterium]